MKPSDPPLPLNTLKDADQPRRLEFDYETGELRLVDRENPKPPHTVVCDVIYQQGFFASPGDRQEHP